MNTDRLLPEDVTTELSNVLNKKYMSARKDRHFTVLTRRDFEQVSVVVLLSNAKETFYYPVEGRLNLVEEEMKPEEGAFFLIDYIGLYFEEFFEQEGSLYLPIDWAPFNYEAVDFELKGQILNRYAEIMADKLLENSEPLSLNQPLPN